MLSPLWYGFLSSLQIAVTEESVQLLAIPHRAMRADTYNGYHIPADATVLGNTWYSHHYLLWPYADTLFLGLFCTTLKFIPTQRLSFPNVTRQLTFLILWTTAHSVTEDGL